MLSMSVKKVECFREKIKPVVMKKQNFDDRVFSQLEAQFANLVYHFLDTMSII